MRLQNSLIRISNLPNCPYTLDELCKAAAINKDTSQAEKDRLAATASYLHKELGKGADGKKFEAVSPASTQRGSTANQDLSLGSSQALFQ